MPSTPDGILHAVGMEVERLLEPGGPEIALPQFVQLRATVGGISAAMTVGLVDALGAEIIHFTPLDDVSELALLTKAMEIGRGEDPFVEPFGFGGSNYVLARALLSKEAHPDLVAIMQGLRVASPALVELVELPANTLLQLSCGYPGTLGKLDGLLDVGQGTIKAATYAAAFELWTNQNRECWRVLRLRAMGREAISGLSGYPESEIRRWHPEFYTDPSPRANVSRLDRGVHQRPKPDEERLAKATAYATFIDMAEMDGFEGNVERPDGVSFMALTLEMDGVEIARLTAFYLAALAGPLVNLAADHPAMSQWLSLWLQDDIELTEQADRMWPALDGVEPGAALRITGLWLSPGARTQSTLDYLLRTAQWAAMSNQAIQDMIAASACAVTVELMQPTEHGSEPMPPEVAAWFRRTLGAMGAEPALGEHGSQTLLLPLHPM